MNAREADRVTLVALELFMGLMAITCGVILATGFADDVLGMQTSVLDGTPFHSFVVPGIILAVVVGGSQLTAAFGLWRRVPWGKFASFVAGVTLMGWIVGEVALLGWIAPHGLQPFCFAYGSLVAALAARHMGLRRVAT